MNFKSDRGSPSCFSAWPFLRSRSTAHPINGNIGNISRPGTASFNIELIANKRTRRGRGNLITVIPFFDHRYPVYRLRRPSEALCNFSLTSRTISKKKKEEKTERNRLGLVSSSIENSSTRHFVSSRILRTEEKEKIGEKKKKEEEKEK